MSAKDDIKARRKQAKKEKNIYSGLLKDDIEQLINTSRKFDFAGWREVVITEHAPYPEFGGITIEDVPLEDNKSKSSTLIIELSSGSCVSDEFTENIAIFLSLSGDIYSYSATIEDSGREESYIFWLNLDKEPWTFTEQLAMNIREVTKKLYLN